MKRKGENPSQENVEKRRKEQIPTENENYTHLNFKLELRDATTIFIALEKFIQQAKGYLEGVRSEDIAANYCRSSPECQEIFQILEAGKRKPQEYALIFETLECLLLRFGDDLSNLKTVGHSLVRRLLAGHMGAIFSMLWPSNKASHIKASLKLLTSMVMLSDSTARDVQAQFDFTHQALPALLLRRNIQDPQDIRTCLLQFIMSFLNSGDSSVVRQLVEQKGFLNSIFFGMVNDRLSTVQLILGTLQEKVVLNPYISKTAKIRLFNDNILKQLLQLYKWKGPTKWKASQEDAMEQEIEIEEDENEDRKVVREQVHSFLLEICCSIKTGINFYDKSIGTSGKNMNHVLTNFLVSITKPYEQPLIQELVVSVLTTCPDQLGRYLPTLQHHFVPRVSAKWIAALEFLHKVYSVLPELSSFLKPTEHVPPQRLVAMAMTLTVPPAAIMNLITQAVKKPSPILRSAVLKLVLLITEKFQRNIASCTGGDGKSAWATYTAKDKQDFTESYTETMIKVLPSLVSIVKSWADLTGKSATETSHTVVDDDSDLVVDSDLTVKDVEIGVYMSRILQTFCCYQLNFPGLLSVYTIDFSSMLEGIKAREADLSLEEKSALQLHVLQLLANSDSRKVNWNKQSEKGRSMMYLLMEMVVTSAGNEELGELTKALLVKMLVNTGLFEDNEAELKLWLKRLETTPVNNQISVLTFLEKTALTLLSNPYPYADRIIEAVSKSAQMGQSNNDEMETGEDILKEILELESIPLQGDGEMEENCQESAQEVHTVERSPFSPLVPVALSLLPVKERNAE
ncbi:nucleolar pre-ribosomal-associated protein 1, partial [Lingula anatina]|uniref:Nucleolar pre-ribosomal-associated protein 1 n=1 Tax=Lingula anatina TaxID=7574 RepID=A0A1S3HXP7_LINAN